MGKDALLHTDHEHHRELEALRGMDGHQRDLIVPAVVGIDVGDQRDLVEEALELGALVVVLAGIDPTEIVGGREQLAQIVDPRLGLRGALLLQLPQIGRALEPTTTKPTDSTT